MQPTICRHVGANCKILPRLKLGVSKEAGRRKEGLLTIDFLNSLEVILRQFEVVCFHVLVERSHDSTGIIGVLQTQRMPQLMDSNQEEIIPCGRKAQPVEHTATASAHPKPLVPINQKQILCSPTAQQVTVLGSAPGDGFSPKSLHSL